MLLEEVESVLFREPFVPLRLHKIDGKTLDIPFKYVARVLDYGVIVFKGVKDERSRQATGYEVVGFDKIDRIEPRKKKGGPRRKKAS